MLGSKKGFLYVFESILAGIIIISFLLILTTWNNPVIAEPKGILKGLDERGILRIYVENNNVDALNDAIGSMGFNYNYTIEICKTGGCVGYKPQKRTMYVETYIVTGYSFYEPAIVRLYIW